MKLYEIPMEAAAIERELVEGLGELTPEMEQHIAQFVTQGKDKIEAAAMVLRSIESEAKACKEEAGRLSVRAAGMERAVDRLKGLMLCAVDQAFSGKVRTPRFTIWGQSSAATTAFELCENADIYMLAREAPWCVRSRDPELDKLALKDAAKNGQPIPEAVKVTEKPGTRFLQVR